MANFEFLRVLGSILSAMFSDGRIRISRSISLQKEVKSLSLSLDF